ncbi:MAG TPA: rhomboid family intramembrane serine protease [Phycisphaerae bacterium]|nr:rhomboid family intramembrane serine protease [Phycisphaerae bacterium]
MLVCPTCRAGLRRTSAGKDLFHLCPKCKGRAITYPVLRRHARRDFMRWLIAAASAPGARRSRRCPSCNGLMVVAEFPTSPQPLEIDVCSRCQLVWFDAGEVARVPKEAAPPRRAAHAGVPLKAGPVPPPIVPPARAPPGVAEPGRDARAVPPPPPLPVRAPPDGGQMSWRPAHWWHWIPGILGMPVEVDGPQMRRRAVVTWAISVLAAALFLVLWGAGELNQYIRDWGFIPRLWTRHHGLTMVSSFFIHASLLHLLSNLYFLVVFGDNAEDRLGVSLYVSLLMLAHLGGMLLHGLFDPRGNVPCVGASAGISGVLGFYAVVFPQVRIGWMWRIFFVVGPWLRMRAWVALLVFAAIQLVGTWGQLQGFSGVSYLAHLGGLAVGIAAGLVSRASQGRPKY